MVTDAPRLTTQITMHSPSCILSKKKKKVREGAEVQIRHGCFLIMLMNGKGMTFLQIPCYFLNQTLQRKQKTFMSWVGMRGWSVWNSRTASPLRLLGDHSLVFLQRLAYFHILSHLKYSSRSVWRCFGNSKAAVHLGLHTIKCQHSSCDQGHLWKTFDPVTLFCPVTKTTALI